MSLSISTRTHFDFSALPLVTVREAFARLEGGARAVYAGVQHTSWARDEAVWDARAGRYGGKNGFGFLRAVASDLSVANAPLEPLTSGAEAGVFTQGDQVARLAAGTALRASCVALYQSADRAQFRVYDDAGSFVERFWSADDDAPIGADFGMLAPGSYALWARLGLDVPAEALASNPELAWAEWSLLRVRVGNGAWAMEANVVAAPGCPLYRKVGDAPVAVTPSNEAASRVFFDLAARIVSASCVLERDIVQSENASVDVARGSLIIAGLRASRSGPQSALWVLNENGTARLLGISESFSNGFCECAKSDHHASDVAQGTDGTLYLLSECSLHLYAPDAPTRAERLPPFPGATQGHPGGQCLRFPGGEIAFWTENLTEGVDDGASFYNRLVRRVGGRDQKGLSSWWHGPNCAELFLGRFWALRGVPASDAPADDLTQGATIYLDWIQNGRWHGFTGLARSAQTHRWQRLRVAGAGLWLFGFAPAHQSEDGTSIPDAPLAAWSDGTVLREVSLPFFVRRATPCTLGGAATLLLSANSAARGMGPPTLVVEATPPEATLPVCAFWNEAQGAFLLDRNAWEAEGHAVEELPAFLAWVPQSGRNGGGVWRAAETEPAQGFWLRRELGAGVVRFVAGGVADWAPMMTEGGALLLLETGVELELN